MKAEAGDAATAIEVTVRERPRLCVMDLYIPGGGISVLREVSHLVPETLVVVLTASEDHNDLIDAIRAGASGYLVKSMDPNRIDTRSAACSRARRRSPASSWPSWFGTCRRWAGIA